MAMAADASMWDGPDLPSSGSAGTRTLSWVRSIFFAIWSLGGLVAPLLVGAVLMAGTSDTRAQPKSPETKPQPAPQAPASAPTLQQQNLPVSVEQALYLIRSTLLTLNDANRSGNYTVLRDLAAPDFQARNTAADLGQSFSDLRRRNFDLYGAALLAPQLTAAPALDQNGMLRLTGYVPTRPMQINFDLLFQVVGGQWRLFGISIATPEASPQVPPTKHGPPVTKKP
jgi:hypothetical protein